MHQEVDDSAISTLAPAERMAVKIKAEEIRQRLRDEQDVEPMDIATLRYDEYLDNPTEDNLRRLWFFMQSLEEEGDTEQ
jgi:hypothetical protein